MFLHDKFGRAITDLRISITDRCNFRCTYCMPEEGMQWLPRSEVLTFEEIERLATIFVERMRSDLTHEKPALSGRPPKVDVDARRGRGFDGPWPHEQLETARLAHPLAGFRPVVREAPGYLHK